MNVFETLGVILEGFLGGGSGGPFWWLLKQIRKFGVLQIKVFSFSRRPFRDISNKYKDSSIPWFLGFGLLFFLCYLLKFIVS